MKKNEEDDFDSLLYEICYSVRFTITKTIKTCKDDELESILPNDSFASFNKNKINFRLDLDYQNFEKQRFFINELLIAE